MTDRLRTASNADDATLLNMVRAGDAAAFGILYQRHQDAARRLAWGLVGTAAEVDDVVAETFARVLDITKRGGGPTDAFRPYLLTALRRVCYDRLQAQRAQVPTEVQDLPDQGEPFVDPAVASLDRSLIVRAFLSLPERWIAVLWHTEVEDASPAEVGPLLGLNRNGVAQLKRRAREGLRQAYLQMHISSIPRQECRPTAERLGAFVRNALPGRDSFMVAEHLRECADCSAAYAELADVNLALRSALAPVVLGGAAAAYLSGHALIGGGAGAAGAAGAGAAAGAGGAAGVAGHGAGTAAGAAGAGGTAAGAAGHGAGAVGASGAGASGTIGTGAAGGAGGAGTGAAGAGAGSAGAGAGMAGVKAGAAADGSGWLQSVMRAQTATRLRHASLPLRLLAAGAAATLAVAGFAIAVTLTGHHVPSGSASRHHVAQAGSTPAAVATTQPPSGQRHSPTPSTVPAVALPTSSGPVAPTPTPPVATSSAPGTTRSPKPTPTPAIALAASISISGSSPGWAAQVVFTVSNTGTAATGEVTASITLPSGAWMIGGGHGHGHDRGHGGWSCQPTSSGATCQYTSIAAGSQSTGMIFIAVGNQAACGQPVKLTATSGGASASAQSPNGIRC